MTNRNDTDCPSSPHRLSRVQTILIFCKVIDNFGDIGVAWRLSRGLGRGLAKTIPSAEVVLYVDDWVACARLIPTLPVDHAIYHEEAVTLVNWRADQPLMYLPTRVDWVIETFSCEIPDEVCQRMTQHIVQKTVLPLWLNLDYLSAEAWTESYHLLPSPQPNGVVKYFYYPGFTPTSGGILWDDDERVRQQSFLQDTTAQRALTRQLGLPDRVWQNRDQALWLFLFCYPHAPIAVLCERIMASLSVLNKLTVRVLSPHTPPSDMPHVPDLTWHMIPFVPQTQFDDVLALCDVNCVRGEDSFVRAQLAGKPMLWHIYPQDDDVHHVKLNAFLAQYVSQYQVGMEAESATKVAALWQWWNGVDVPPVADSVEQVTAWLGQAGQMHAQQWQTYLYQQPSLYQRLMNWLLKKC